MSLLEIQRLTRQTQKQASVIKSQQTQIRCLQSNIDTVKHLLKCQQQQKSKLHQQIHALNSKLQAHEFQRQQTQSRYFQVLTKLQQQLQTQKSKYNKLENKIAPLVDHDSVRLKILTEVQYGHQIQLEKQKRAVIGFKDQVLRLKRQNQLLRNRCDSLKIEYEEDLRKIRIDREKGSKTRFDDISYEMCQEIQTQLRQNCSQLMKEAQYYKQRYFNSEKKHQQKMRALEKELTQRRNER